MALTGLYDEFKKALLSNLIDLTKTRYRAMLFSSNDFYFDPSHGDDYLKITRISIPLALSQDAYVDPVTMGIDFTFRACAFTGAADVIVILIYSNGTTPMPMCSTIFPLARANGGDITISFDSYPVNIPSWHSSISGDNDEGDDNESDNFNHEVYPIYKPEIW